MDLPERSATDRYIKARGSKLDYKFDIDLGELIPGHHVVVRGIGPAPIISVPPTADLPREDLDNIDRSNQTPRDQVHFEHVPGLTPDSATPTWSLTVSDNAGTRYSGVDEGAYDGQSGGPATHGVRELGGKIPATATFLSLVFDPGYDREGDQQWVPTGPWKGELCINLRAGQVCHITPG